MTHSAKSLADEADKAAQIAAKQRAFQSEQRRTEAEKMSLLRRSAESLESDLAESKRREAQYKAESSRLRKEARAMVWMTAVATTAAVISTVITALPFFK